MKDYQIRPMAIGTVDIPKMLMTNQYGIGEVITEGVYSWYIEGPKENILIDTACRMQLLRFPVSKNVITPEQRLKDFGLKPSDIDIVIATHLMYDHIGYCALYPNAKFYAQKKEYEFAIDPHPAYKHYYDKRLFENVDFELLDGDCKIVDGVSVLFTPGHTPGTQSVLIETKVGIVGITGFCCIAQNFEPPVAMNTRDGIINIGMYYDPIEAYDNMLKLRDACDIIIPLHELEYLNVDRIPIPEITYNSRHKIR